MVFKNAENIPVLDFDFHLECSGNAARDRLHAFSHQNAKIVRKPSDRACKLRLAGNYVMRRAGVELRDGKNRRFQRVRVPAHDGLQSLPKRYCGHYRVFRKLRHGGMAAVAFHGDIEKIGTGHGWARENDDFSRIEVWRVVKRINFIARELLEETIGDHGLCAAETLLGRLENE